MCNSEIAIKQRNKLKEAEEKAKKEGLRSPYAFEYNNKLYIF